jgi:hypothetical protein
MATIKPNLKDCLNKSIDMIEDIKKNSFGDSTGLKPRLDKAKLHLDCCLTGLNKRNTAKELLSQLSFIKETDNTEEVLFFDSTQKFSFLRFNFFTSYLSSTWGVYDNINNAIKLIHALEQNSGGEFITVLENTNTIDIDKKCELLQEYKFAGHFFYQMRNAFLHLAPSVHVGNNGFKSTQVADRFTARPEMFEFLYKLAVEKKYLKDPKATNKARELGLNQERCLLEVSYEMETMLDEFASKYLLLSLRQKKPIEW